MKLQYRRTGRTGVVGAAELLPFRSHSLDSIWTVGRFHHLTGSKVTAALSEMARVCRRGGRLITFDAVTPHSAHRHPIAYLQRRLDRGRFGGSEDQPLSGSLPGLRNSQRFTYSRNGFECIAGCMQLGGDSGSLFWLNCLSI
ncbi:MAG: methyltransferase domain-containing protein [Bryobacteraceae bacterium]